MSFKSKNTKLLFFVLIGLSLTLNNVSYGYTISATDSPTHYRIHFAKTDTPIQITKIEKKIIIRGKEKTVNDLFSWLRENKYSKKYIKSASLNKRQELVINVAKSNIEAFSFIRRKDRSLIIDLWENLNNSKKQKEDKVNIKMSSNKKRKNKTNIKKSLKKVKTQEINKKVKNKKILESKFRDFRYGLNFIWDYDPIFPEFEKIVEIKRKTPLHFYQIKQRDYEKSELEAHMQLTINLFNKDKWGLMNKSIDLYYKKYGKDKNEPFNEFLKIVALIKNDYLNGDTTPKKEVIKRIEELERMTDEFNLSKALLKYVFQYYVETKDFISSLKVGKRLFVLTKEDYDTEGLVESLHGIIYSLSKLNQYDKIQSLLEDKEVEKYLEKIQIVEYRIYNYLLNGEYQLALEKFEKIKSSIIGQIPATILYNLGESSFRQGNYQDSIKYFDQFLKDYSFSKNSSHARLRIALSYDLLGKNEKLVKRLYRDAIDRSSNPNVRYEASLRYFGFMALRNIEGYKLKDLEGFIEPPLEISAKLNKNLLSSKWQIRLRSFISRGQYDIALQYLKSIPMSDLKPEKQRVFKKDGAAVLSYKMSELFKEELYSELIQLHETYNKKITDPETYYLRRHELLGMAYYKMNIPNSYNKIIKTIKKQKQVKIQAEYPAWKRMVSLSDKNLSLLKLLHLNELKTKDSKKSFSICNKIRAINTVEGDFCFGKTNFVLKNYKQSKKDFEKIISEHHREIKNTEFSKEVSYLYLMSLYNQRYFDKFTEIVKKILSENAFSGMGAKNEEEIKYLYLETVYSNKRITIDKHFFKLLESYIQNYKVSKWIDRVRYLKASSLIKVGKPNEGKKELDNLIKSTKKEYIKDLARSELASLILNNKNI